MPNTNTIKTQFLAIIQAIVWHQDVTPAKGNPNVLTINQVVIIATDIKPAGNPTVASIILGTPASRHSSFSSLIGIPQLIAVEAG